MTEHIAMSLYKFNVRQGERARKIWDHFGGNCADPDTLCDYVDSRFWATEMPLATAKVYLQHALERYGEEAKERG